MAGLFPIDLVMHPKPVGHGYTSVRVDTPNPFYAVGTSLRGHEFHYSGLAEGPQGEESCMRVESGVGLGSARDGLVRCNTLACYTHVHADGVESWASAMRGEGRRPRYETQEHKDREQRDERLVWIGSDLTHPES